MSMHIIYLYNLSVYIHTLVLDKQVAKSVILIQIQTLFCFSDVLFIFLTSS